MENVSKVCRRCCGSIFFGFAFALLAISTLAQSVVKPDEPLGHVFFTIRSANGSLVDAQPTRDTMKVRIGGHSVEVETVRSLKTAPLNFFVLMDVSGSSGQFALQQDALVIELFHALSIGHNRGYLVLFDQTVLSDEQPAGMSALEEMIRPFDQTDRKGMTALYDAVVQTATGELAFSKIPEESPRAMFILSDGDDNYGHKTLDDALNALQRAAIPVFSLEFPSMRSSLPVTVEPFDVLKALADATGGLGAFLSEPASGPPAAALLANLASSQWFVSFKLPALKMGKWYPLKIESSDKNTHLVAQKEYFVQ